MWKKETGYAWLIRAVPIVLLAVLVLLLARMWLLCENMNANSLHRGLRYGEEVLSGKNIKNFYQNYKEEEKPQITAWKKKGLQQVKKADGGNGIQTEIWQVAGQLEQVLKLPLESGGFGNGADESGCILSSQAAYELFGSTDVCQIKMQWNQEVYFIRGVVKSEDNFMVVHAEDSEKMNYVEVELPSEGVQLTSVLSQLGLAEPQAYLNGRFLLGLMRLVMTLPLWMAYLFFVICYWKKKRYLGWKKRALSQLVLLFLFGAGAVSSLDFGQDFLPSSWSDFTYWSDKMTQVVSNWKKGMEYRNLIPESVMYGQLHETIVLAVAGGICVLVIYKVSRRAPIDVKGIEEAGAR